MKFSERYCLLIQEILNMQHYTVPHVHVRCLQRKALTQLRRFSNNGNAEYDDEVPGSHQHHYGGADMNNNYGMATGSHSTASGMMAIDIIITSSTSFEPNTFSFDADINNGVMGAASATGGGLHNSAPATSNRRQKRLERNRESARLSQRRRKQ